MNVICSIEESFRGMENGVFSFFIDKNFPAFNGHFPSFPILPGIVQVEMALFCIKKILNNENANIQEIRKIKFIKPIFPQTEVFVEIIQNDSKFNATVKDCNVVFSQIFMSVK
ncbi:MAG: hypothetical protein LBQ37_04685 [Elusimicrobiota bacterium]|jgi:3-hydroxymyristoyl/3-hydroxydecanoyl-(acyl carrier protein) dehydratase|nr:hypothetical protein [Elusimicrobiota bacterium]